MNNSSREEYYKIPISYMVKELSRSFRIMTACYKNKMTEGGKRIKLTEIVFFRP